MARFLRRRLLFPGAALLRLDWGCRMFVTRQVISVILGIVLGLAALPPRAHAQSIAAGLGHLLTDQAPPPAGYVRDMRARFTPSVALDYAFGF